jgi:DHA3 family tetracycline resistance protein-like MFS transporter
MSLFRALRFRPFALIWLGQTVSRLGDSLFNIALAWWILVRTGSPAAMGTVQIATMLPRVLFLLIGGVMADRLPRLRMMLGSDVLRGVLVLSITALMVTGQLEIWEIYIASLMFGLVDAFFQPAYSAAIPEIASAEILPSANSLTMLSGEFAGIIGPAIGALIVAVGGSALAFGLDSASFFVSALCLLPILGLSVIRKAKAGESRPNALQDLREGLRAVFASPWLWITIFLAAFVNMAASGVLAVSLPFLIKDHLHSDVGGLGIVLTALSIGSIIGAAVMGRMRKLKRRGLWTYLVWITALALIGCAGLVTTVPALVVIALVAGALLSAGQLVWVNVLQELVPQNLLGRVSSVDQFGSMVLTPIGFGIAGWLTAIIGAPLVFMVGGGLAAGAMSLGLLHPEVRNLE